MRLLRASGLQLGILSLVFTGVNWASSGGPTTHTLFDAYPLSDSVASLCLNMVVDGKSQPVALVYFQGPPGWHNRKWQSNTNGSLVGGKEANYELTSGELVLTLRVSADAQTAHVQGKPFALAENNVFLVKDADKKAAEVVGLGRFDLPSISGNPLAVAAARTYPAIAEALGLGK